MGTADNGKYAALFIDARAENNNTALYCVGHVTDVGSLESPEVIFRVQGRHRRVQNDA